MVPFFLLKFMFSKNATKIDEIFPVDLTVTTYCQIDGEDFVNFWGLLRKRELYVLCIFEKITFSNFSCMFLNPNNFFQFEF